MKRMMHAVLAMLFLTSSFAFTSTKNDGLDAIYGVSDDDPSRIELALNKDYTFSYRDFSDPAHTITVQGTYLLKHNTVVLLAPDNTKFHSKWRLSEEGMKAASRKGLSFYTLRKK